MMRSPFLFLVLLAATAADAVAGPPTQETASAAVIRFLVENKINPHDHWIQNHDELQDAALEKTFHDHRFYLLRFRQWPVARENPPPLQANNLFAVSDTLKVTLITNGDELLKFFQEHGAKPSKQTAIAWALLHKELLDDGMFHLKLRQDSVKSVGTKLGERFSVTVAPDARGDNRGECVFVLQFDEVGKPLAQTVENNLKEGMRPRCQSMRLIHPDDAVRRLAERELLSMGRDALPYLRERLEIVHPSLAEKILYLIQRIESAD
jgi:hypothetical protein